MLCDACMKKGLHIDTLIQKIFLLMFMHFPGDLNPENILEGDNLFPKISDY